MATGLSQVKCRIVCPTVEGNRDRRPTIRTECKIFRSGASALIDERAIRSKGETIMEQKNEKKSCCAGCACAPGACACGNGACGCGPSCTCVNCTCPSECNC